LHRITALSDDYDVRAEGIIPELTVQNTTLEYDYVDSEVPVLARMYAKRRVGYRTIGYEISLPPGEGQAQVPQLALQEL